MTGLSRMLDVLVRKAVPDGAPGRVEEWVRHHRLEPMVFGVEWPEELLRAEFLDECRAAYLNMTGRAVRYRAEAEILMAALEGSGIRSCAWRGVVYGEDLYGDPGLRYCTDIDLMVERSERDAALACLLARGCLLRTRLMPRWYLSRHHLHWPLMTPGGIPVDVHWAVDHPYSDTAGLVTVASMQDPAGRLIAAVCHAEKEARLRRMSSLDGMVRDILMRGPIVPWVDIQLMRERYPAGVVRDASGFFGMRGMSTLWSRTVSVLDRLFDPLMETGGAEMEASGGATPVMVSFAGALGCRAEALLDWVDYLRGDSSRHGAPSRVGFPLRLARVVRLAIDTLVCLPWMAWCRWRRSHGRVVPG